MDTEYFIIQEKYKIKISHIISSQKEYINIYIKNTISKEKFNSNFDFDFLKNKSFFESLNLKIIHDIIKLQFKNNKVKIDNITDKLKIIILFSKDVELFELIIPKYNPEKKYDKEEI